MFCSSSNVLYFRLGIILKGVDISPSEHIGDEVFPQEMLRRLITG